MPPRLTVRERVRAELTREITDVARTQLAADGAAALSLRAVARELGMVSSAIYRYFASRDELLTALIIEGYDALGVAVEQAEAACARDDYPARWRAAAGAARDWALAHPHEYALLYGSPVPGYQAPADTIAPAARTAAVFGGLVSEAQAAGVLQPPVGPPVPPTLTADLAQLRAELMPGVPDEVVAAALTVWAAVFGLISFELFGQFNNVLADRDTYFGRALADLARLFGLPA
ncbi:MAG TPA: TetR/AcrR family transcriptional regulator [Streptosporangiaceae bacterium]|jgi:AcrR family transcriptional regulator